MHQYLTHAPVAVAMLVFVSTGAQTQPEGGVISPKIPKKRKRVE